MSFFVVIHELLLFNIHVYNFIFFFFFKYLLCNKVILVGFVFKLSMIFCYNELSQKSRFHSVPIAALWIHNIQRANLGFKKYLCSFADPDSGPAKMKRIRADPDPLHWLGKITYIFLLTASFYLSFFYSFHLLGVL